MRTTTLWLLALACALSPRALAVTRSFTETYETRTGAQGDAQIETWVDDDRAIGDWDTWRVWWGGTASLTDSLEVSAYAVMAQDAYGYGLPQGGVSSGLALEMIYLMVRDRLFGEADHGFSGLLQLELCIPALSTAANQAYYPYLAHANALGEKLALQWARGRFTAAANLTFEEALVLSPDGSTETFHDRLSYSAGLAYSLLEPGPRGSPATLGLETFGDLPFARGGPGGLFWPGGFPWAVGPALSVASGRFWASTSVGYAPFGAYALPALGGQPTRWDASELVGRLIFAFEM
ncbi:MAG: hypothetical protein ACYCWW_06665 [Deltaproteobacteria bacterium]